MITLSKMQMAELKGFLVSDSIELVFESGKAKFKLQEPLSARYFEINADIGVDGVYKVELEKASLKLILKQGSFKVEVAESHLLFNISDKTMIAKPRLFPGELDATFSKIVNLREKLDYEVFSQITELLKVKPILNFDKNVILSGGYIVAKGPAAISTTTVEDIGMSMIIDTNLYKTIHSLAETSKGVYIAKYREYTVFKNVNGSYFIVKANTDSADTLQLVNFIREMVPLASAKVELVHLHEALSLEKPKNLSVEFQLNAGIVILNKINQTSIVLKISNNNENFKVFEVDPYTLQLALKVFDTSMICDIYLYETIVEFRMFNTSIYFKIRS